MAKIRKSAVITGIVATAFILIAWEKNSGTSGHRVGPSPIRRSIVITPTDLLPEYPVTDDNDLEIKVGEECFSTYWVSVPMYVWVNDGDRPLMVEPGKEPHLGDRVTKLRFRCIDKPNGRLYLLKR